MSLWMFPSALLAFYAAHEVVGLFLFLLIEEIGAPLFFPGEALIIAAGARPERTVTGDVVVIFVAALAATLGSSVLYTLVHRGGRPLLARYGRILHLNEGRVGMLEAWFRRHGMLAIVAGRLFPGLRTPTSIMAGLFGVPFRTFLPATMLATVLWAAVYYLIGAFLQMQSQAIVGAALGHLQAVVIAGVSLVVLAGLGWIVWRRVGSGVHDPLGRPDSC